MPLRAATMPSYAPDRSSCVLRTTARLLAFVLALLATGCPHNSGAQDLSSLPAITTSDPHAEADLRAAREASVAGHAAEAERLYRAFLAEHSADPLVPLAHLGLGR